MSLLDLVQPARRAGMTVGRTAVSTAVSAVGIAADGAVGAARLTGRVANGAVRAPSRTTALASDVARQGAAAAEAAPRQVVSVAKALVDAHPRRTHRLSQLFGCTLVGPFGWAIVLGSSTMGTLAAAAAPRVLPVLGQSAD